MTPPRPEVQTAKLEYYADTDSLYIDLAPRPSVESREVSDGVVLDYDADGNLVGIDIDHASRKLDLSELTLSRLPGVVKQLGA
ncbi:MAG: DUF2283 domain-containing protein [Candidatus Binatia bacterium]